MEEATDPRTLVLHSYLFRDVLEGVRGGGGVAKDAALPLAPPLGPGRPARTVQLEREDYEDFLPAAQLLATHFHWPQGDGEEVGVVAEFLGGEQSSHRARVAVTLLGEIEAGMEVRAEEEREGPGRRGLGTERSSRRARVADTLLGKVEAEES